MGPVRRKRKEKKMKKIANVVLVIALAAILIKIGMMIAPQEIDQVYPRVAYIIEINEDEGWMILRDYAGLEWKADVEDFWYGEYVAMMMHDNGTPYWIYDDIILTIR